MYFHLSLPKPKTHQWNKQSSHYDYIVNVNDKVDNGKGIDFLTIREDFGSVTEINDDVDIPMIGEGTEKKVLNAVYKALVRALKKVEV